MILKRKVSLKAWRNKIVSVYGEDIEYPISEAVSLIDNYGIKDDFQKKSMAASQ